jgi:hypothetical protein
MPEEKDGADEGFTVRVLDGCAAPVKKSKRFKDKFETHYEDAGFFEDKKKGETAFIFTEGIVVFKERSVEGKSLDELQEGVAGLETLEPEVLLKDYVDQITKEHFCFRIIIGGENMLSCIQDKMWIAKLLFRETGSLGAAEMSMLATAVLDFGENAWVISPMGVLLVGEIAEIKRCIYLVGLTMTGVATHMAIANELEHQLYETPPTFTEKELSVYEGKLEKISDTVSYVINDVRDEMLNADPRTVLIIKKLHEVMSLVEHESRVNVFMDVARRKVERARTIKASREAKRLAAILFAFSMIIAISNIIVIWVNLTKNIVPPIEPGYAILIELPIIIAVLLLVIVLFKEIFKTTLKF